MATGTGGNHLHSSYAIACMEVWGGNQATRTNVSLPGLAAWVCSEPFETSSGGDVYYLSDCNSGALSRVVLADVSGHGPNVSDVAVRLRSQMYRHINTWDQSEFVRDLGDTLRRDGHGTNYATAIILSYLPAKRQLLLTNAGHPEPLWYHAADDRWELLTDDVAAATGELSGLPLGMIPGTSYRQSVIPLECGDMVILYTDSLIESETPGGDQVGRDRLLGFARQAPTDSPAMVGESLVRQVRSFTVASAKTDDETIIVLQRLHQPEPAVEIAGSRSRNRYCGTVSRGNGSFSCCAVHSVFGLGNHVEMDNAVGLEVIVEASPPGLRRPPPVTEQILAHAGLSRRFGVHSFARPSAPRRREPYGRAE